MLVALGLTAHLLLRWGDEDEALGLCDTKHEGFHLVLRATEHD